MTDNSPFSKLDHVGIIVRDMDKATEYLQSLGIGPFKPFNKVVRYDAKLYGKPVDPGDIKLEIKLADIGAGVKIEMIQPLDGGPWREFLEAKGGGMHHLAFDVDDVDKAETELIEKGATVIYKVRFEGGGGAVYLDTSEFGGLVDVIEFVKWAPGMIPD